MEQFVREEKFIVTLLGQVNSVLKAKFFVSHTLKDELRRNHDLALLDSNRTLFKSS